MKIYIPHIEYTVEVSFNSKTKLELLQMECACEYVKNGLCRLHFKRKPKHVDFPSVAHEVMHVIQNISKDRGIDIEKEEEHCAYMMQFILNKILGYKYDMVNK